MDEKQLKNLEKLHKRALSWDHEGAYDAGQAIIETEVPKLIAALRAAWAQAEEAQRDNAIYHRMLDPIFEAYERMGSSEQDYAQKDRDTLEAVKAAHMLIGQLRKSNSSTPRSGEEEKERRDEVH